MRTAIISTVRNEGPAVEHFIENLLSQSRTPDQIVICDGGSTDDTVEHLHRLTKKYSSLTVISKPGSIAVGRNAAIATAKADIIAVTDAGSRVDEHWFEEITSPFADKAISAVAGYYAIDPQTPFEAASGYLMNQNASELDDSWLPSSRSIAFRKHVWEKVGGYPEDLTFAGEDTLFDIRIVEAGFPFKFQPSAIVYWRPRPTLHAFYRQYFLYAKGDGQRWPESRGYTKKIITYIIFLALLVSGFILSPSIIIADAILYLAYLLFRARKTWQRSHNFSYFLRSIPLVIVFDKATLMGFFRGMFDWIRTPLYRKPYEITR